MFEVVEWTIEELPEARPRHLLGIGEVDDLVRGVELGIDTFDCAMPTRIGRHGMALVPDPEHRWRVDLAKARWKEADEPLLDGCPCPACAEGYSRAYLHYLFKAKEQTAMRLLTIHNLAFLAAPDGRAARRDRRGPAGGGRGGGPRRAPRRGSWGVDDFKAFEARGWSARAGTYDALMARATAVAIEPLLDAAAVGPGLRVLDVGCGLGALAAAAAARGARVTGVDLAEGMLAEARRRHPEIEFVRADAEALPFADAAFDVALGAFLVNHLPDAETAVAEMSRVAGRVALAAWGPEDEVAFLALPARAAAQLDPARPRRPELRALRRPGRARRAARRRHVSELAHDAARRHARRALGRHPRRHRPHRRPARGGVTRGPRTRPRRAHPPRRALPRRGRLRAPADGPHCVFSSTGQALELTERVVTEPPTSSLSCTSRLPHCC